MTNKVTGKTRSLRNRFTQNAEEFDALMTEMLAENESLLARNRELENMLTDRLELIKCGIAHNYGGDPYENERYTSVVELLSVT